jgi:hypothetical protein
MPTVVNPLRSIQRKDTMELLQVALFVSCDGVSNSLTVMSRLMRPVTRDETGAIVETGEVVTKQYALSDFAPAVQTALTNFINAIDNKV